ncbi:MAG: Rne/Rng family ribonuclease [Planctomycetota bacterium]|nr:Rne/Rng family ribonuclease [Planctomycetota bacterium]
MVSTKKSDATELMVVNVTPGEECRIAILQDNHLEELYTERAATATNVGNIYKGRVTNVESAIQAAFIDYGQGRAGFLHISDLHPRYFPGAKRTERVGMKIPRHARPPIQDALKRGDEVLVQVLKEGLGTKGPTLTSYLSIPGRLLVMMPEMDRVGVSRKVEDPVKRRQMRQVLDSLKLPQGFGFILRTAGFGKTRTDLTRDVAYLVRLWKVMDRRIKDIGAPCELYTESDLFIRTIRDVLRPSISAVIVDCESAHERAAAFLSVVAPRSAPKLIRYRSPVPIFHAFDIERQIDLIHSREVPLPSGGKLVIDQTEALVAIDVNSGRSRRATDSETNAFGTNCEAVDEICRQLRLRDLGGLVINDLIDMHRLQHRREVEERFRQALKRDRARTTMLRISEFGIVELTRQRMRPSLRMSHFMPCGYCDGQGEIKTPQSLGADAMRQVGYVLQFDRVRRVEVVCSPRVASVLLSSKRRELVALEDASGKTIDVRVSDAIAVDRVDFFAYDDRGAEMDVAKLPPLQVPTIGQLEAAQSKERAKKPAPAGTSPTKKRRRRRRGAPADATTLALAEGADTTPDRAGEGADAASDEAGAARPAETPSDGSQATKKPRRRRSRRGRGRPREDGSIPVHQLARDLGVASREILSRCKAQDDLDLNNHMSLVTPPMALRIRTLVGTEGRAADAKTPPVDSAGRDVRQAPTGTKTSRRRKTVPRAADAPAARSRTGSADPRSDADGSGRAPESFTTAGRDDRGAEKSSRHTGKRAGVRKNRRPKVAGSRSAGRTNGSVAAGQPATTKKTDRGSSAQPDESSKRDSAAAGVETAGPAARTMKRLYRSRRVLSRTALADVKDNLEE